jgi:aspartyl aminopeptidase
LTDRAKGQWRIFGKLGLGTKGQFVEVDYACFPALDAAGAAIFGMGREFVLAVHLDQGGASWAARDRLLAKATRTIVRAVIEGRL